MKNLLATMLSLIPGLVIGQENRIDIIRPDAPELSSFGDYAIGVKTLEAVASNRPDILGTEEGGETVYYDRALTLEVWYPAELAADQVPGTEYRTITRNPAITATLKGRAVRGAMPLKSGGPYPLVIISHGYPGNRFLMSHLGENLASKGYVVASIDHRDSTYDDQRAFSSTLYNRPLDQRQVIDFMALISGQADSDFFGMVDANNTGIVGYSMGGYGLVNNIGGGYNDEVVDARVAPPNRLLDEHATGNADYRGKLDSRLKAGFAIAPWGMNTGFWRPEDLAGITVPTFYLAGDADTVSGYENGTRAIFENAVNSNRYLLTFKNAGHNAGAPYPLPVEILNSKDQTGASHYTDPVWDTVRMNNIMDHFATAFFGYYLKGIQDRLDYLTLVPDGADAVHSMTDGRPNPEHNYWKGFNRRTAVGLKLEYLEAGR